MTANNGIANLNGGNPAITSGRDHIIVAARFADGGGGAINTDLTDSRSLNRASVCRIGVMFSTDQKKVKRLIVRTQTFKCVGFEVELGA
jgi:hypothetical protein